MAERCTAKTASGGQCKCKRQLYSDTCALHGKAGAAGRKKGGQQTSAKMAAIDAQLAEFDLRSPENQKKHLAAWIAKLTDEGESVANIARLYALLIQLTKESDPTQRIEITRVINRPS